MKRILSTLYVALFLGLCAFPVVGMLTHGPSDAISNETTVQPPSLTTADGSFNTEFLQDTSDFFAKRFAFRPELITLRGEVCAALLHQSGTDRVILGKDDCLFFADTLPDYEGTNAMTDREVASAARSLLLMEEYVRSQGGRFLFTIAPNKNSLYGDRMPDRFPERTLPSNAERLTAALEENSVSYADLFSPLSEAPEFLYRTQDSHWTQQGAGLAGDCILDALEQAHTPFYGSDVLQEETEPGDLYRMASPAGTEPDVETVYERSFTFTYAEGFHSCEDREISTSCAGKSGSLLMFRDSFGNALHLFLAENYGTARFLKSNPYTLCDMADTQADTVVIELVERNLSYLNRRAAVFPAPVREAERGQPASDAVITVTVSEADQMPGFSRVSGTLSDCALDAGSPILLWVGETAYEATPAGDGEHPFTAYVPTEALGASLSVQYFESGQAVLSACTASANKGE